MKGLDLVLGPLVQGLDVVLAEIGPLVVEGLDVVIGSLVQLGARIGGGSGVVLVVGDSKIH